MSMPPYSSPESDPARSPGAPSADRDDLQPSGRGIGGYALQREVGRGAMGEVWLGLDRRLDRKVAIKMMRCEIADDPTYVQRFEREARAVARLSHPHIVQIYGIGEEEGTLFLAMEWIDGPTLSSVIRESGSLPRKEALRILIQAADALDYACSLGIIHRDIKPGNILLDQSGRVKLADFGLAKIAGQTVAHMTQTGTPMGTPNYMSPEACRGEELDHRADIYSLGVTFYQLLKGELPYSASTPMSVMFKHVHEPLPEPQMLQLLDRGIWLDVLRKMTAKDPAARFRTYGELREALAQLDSASSGDGLRPVVRDPSSMVFTPSAGSPQGAEPVDLFHATVAAGAVTNQGVRPEAFASSLLGSPGYSLTGGYAPNQVPARPASSFPWRIVGITSVAMLIAAAATLLVLDSMQGSTVTAYPPQSHVSATPVPSLEQAPASTVPPPSVLVAAPPAEEPGERPGPPPDMSAAPMLASVFQRIDPRALAAYKAYDFESLLAYATAAVQSPQLDASTRTLLQNVLPHLQTLKDYRSKLVAYTTSAPGTFSYHDSHGAAHTLMSANEAGGVFSTSTGAQTPLSWDQIPGPEMIVLGEKLSAPRTHHVIAHAFMALYPGIRDRLPRPGGTQVGAQQGGRQQGGPPPAPPQAGRAGGPGGGGQRGQRR